jgi:hypothetical protein
VVTKFSASARVGVNDSEERWITDTLTCMKLDNVFRGGEHDCKATDKRRHGTDSRDEYPISHKTQTSSQERKRSLH